jgi:hypothetical protein
MPTGRYKRCVNSSGQRPTPRRTRCAECAADFASGEDANFCWDPLERKPPSLGEKTRSFRHLRLRRKPLPARRSREEARLTTSSRVLGFVPSNHMCERTPRTLRQAATTAEFASKIGLAVLSCVLPCSHRLGNRISSVQRIFHGRPEQSFGGCMGAVWFSPQPKYSLS